jgi:hypothetical protein
MLAVHHINGESSDHSRKNITADKASDNHAYREAKADYVRSLLVGRLAFRGMADAALLYWHSGIYLRDAMVYMDRYEKKMRKTRK